MHKMTDWLPISEEKLYELILKAESEMSPKEQRLWENIKIVPEKWNEPSYGHVGGGFWAVAVLGVKVLWYNDIDHGFNLSKYSMCGTIDEFFGNQDELRDVVHRLGYYLEHGY